MVNYGLLVQMATEMGQVVEDFKNSKPDFDFAGWYTKLELLRKPLCDLFDTLPKDQKEFYLYIQGLRKNFLGFDSEMHNKKVIEPDVETEHGEDEDPSERQEMEPVIEREHSVSNSGLIVEEKDQGERSKETGPHIESEVGVSNSKCTYDSDEADRYLEDHYSRLNSADVVVSSTDLSDNDVQIRDEVNTPRRWEFRKCRYRPGFYSKKTSSTKRGRSRGRGTPTTTSRGENGRGRVMENTETNIGKKANK